MTNSKLVVEPGVNYLLGRSDAEYVRLNKQHEWQKKFVYDGKLIIDSTVKIPPDGAVLDAGVGTGNWSLELAQELPSTVTLQGLDISDQLLPPELPPNMKFTLGAVTALPTEWTGKFDFVHQRLLVLALQAVEWPVAIAEFFRALKPGGYIQIIELSAQWPDHTELRRKHKELTKALLDEKGLLFDCGDRIPQFMAEAGFINIVHDKKPIPATSKEGEWGKRGRYCFGHVWRHMADTAVKAGGFGIVNTVEEFDDFMDALDKEDDMEGVGPTWYVMDVIRAQKPVV